MSRKGGTCLVSRKGGDMSSEQEGGGTCLVSRKGGDMSSEQEGRGGHV